MQRQRSVSRHTNETTKQTQTSHTIPKQNQMDHMVCIINYK